MDWGVLSTLRVTGIEAPAVIDNALSSVDGLLRGLHANGNDHLANTDATNAIDLHIGNFCDARSIPTGPAR
jgi:hypothetical protein